MKLATVVRHALWVVLFASFAFLDVSSVASKASTQTWGDVGQRVTNENQSRPSGKCASEDTEVQS
jgi:hypothetical protein